MAKLASFTLIAIVLLITAAAGGAADDADVERSMLDKFAAAGEDVRPAKLSLPMIILLVVLILVVIVTDVWAIFDNVRWGHATVTTVAWVLVVLFLPILGPMFYLIFGHLPRMRAAKAGQQEPM